MAIKKHEYDTEANPRKLKISVPDAESEWSDKDTRTASAIGDAGVMVGRTIDPNQEGAGSALSGAASGAAIGTSIAPGYGTAIGAAIGLGLGVINADRKRKENKAARDADAAAIMAKGLEKASGEMAKVNLRFGTSGKTPSSFSAKRNLK